MIDPTGLDLTVSVDDWIDTQMQHMLHPVIATALVRSPDTLTHTVDPPRADRRWAGDPRPATADERITTKKQLGKLSAAFHAASLFPDLKHRSTIRLDALREFARDNRARTVFEAEVVLLASLERDHLTLSDIIRNDPRRPADLRLFAREGNAALLATYFQYALLAQFALSAQLELDDGLEREKAIEAVVTFLDGRVPIEVTAQLVRRVVRAVGRVSLKRMPATLILLEEIQKKGLFDIL